MSGNKPNAIDITKSEVSTGGVLNGASGAGTTGQFLTKFSNEESEYEWADPAGVVALSRYDVNNGDNSTTDTGRFYHPVDLKNFVTGLVEDGLIFIPEPPEPEPDPGRDQWGFDVTVSDDPTALFTFGDGTYPLASGEAAYPHSTTNNPPSDPVNFYDYSNRPLPYYYELHVGLQWGWYNDLNVDIITKEQAMPSPVHYMQLVVSPVPTAFMIPLYTLRGEVTVSGNTLEEKVDYRGDTVFDPQTTDTSENVAVMGQFGPYIGSEPPQVGDSNQTSLPDPTWDACVDWLESRDPNNGPILLILDQPVNWRLTTTDAWNRFRNIELPAPLLIYMRGHSIEKRYNHSASRFNTRYSFVRFIGDGEIRPVAFSDNSSLSPYDIGVVDGLRSLVAVEDVDVYVYGRRTPAIDPTPPPIYPVWFCARNSNCPILVENCDLTTETSSLYLRDPNVTIDGYGFTPSTSRKQHQWADQYVTDLGGCTYMNSGIGGKTYPDWRPYHYQEGTGIFDPQGYNWGPYDYEKRSL